MSILTTKQISFKPPRFESVLDQHLYPPGLGWYKISVVGLGDTEAAAKRNAVILFAQAQINMQVIIPELNRVPETSGAAEKA